jgi:hypothetical protein
MRIPKAKPCPFCKSADVWVERYGLCCYGVVCNDCLSAGPRVEHGDYSDYDKDDGVKNGERDAIRLWNARTPESHHRVLVSCEMRAASEL